MTLVLIWLCTTFLIAGVSVLAGKRHGVEYPIAVFASLAMLANILASKIVVLGDWAVPAGTLVFITTYLITDLISEIWGKSKAKKAVWVGLYVNIMAAICVAIAVSWPAVDFQAEFSIFYDAVLGNSWRIILASMLAYLVSMHLDVIFFHHIKDLTKGKHLWLRNNLATIPANFIGALIFGFTAFYGVVPSIWQLIFTLAFAQSVMVLIDTPFAYAILHVSKFIDTKKS
jgi:uncharacterized integral membrane protein (TIGR00697 family)